VFKCFNVIFSKERGKGGKQSDGDEMSVSEDSSIFDHSETCSALWASSKQLTKSMVYNSHVAQRMVSSCKNVNVPEIMQAVEQEQGASAGPSSKTRRCVHGMRQPMSTISNLPVDYDYIFLTSFPQAFET